MQIRNLDRDAEPFTTADGSTIRELMNVIHPPTRNQSLTEASLPAGAATERDFVMGSGPIAKSLRTRDPIRIG